MKKFLLLLSCISLLNADDTLEEFYKGFNSFYGEAGVKKDYKEAFKHFSSIEDKNNNAKYYIMMMYRNGLGVDSNKDEYYNRFKDLNYPIRFLR